jgi:hypothetical protein
VKTPGCLDVGFDVVGLCAPLHKEVHKGQVVEGVGVGLL